MKQLWQKLLTTLLLILFVFPAFSQTIFKEALSPRNANYDISAKLNPEKKIVNGKMQLNWINITNDTITELQFHLYLNAFKNTGSTFMTESGGSFRGSSAGGDELAWGWIDILSMRQKDGYDLTKNIEFIRPDDGNENDQTVIRVQLNDSILPGKSIDLDIDFTSKLPKIFARTGYSDNYFLVGQWFPKIAVYEPAGMRFAKKGGWNCHQFHANSEFYADYGVYNVNITLPKDYVVGATGILAEEKINGNEKTIKYHAEDVIDFVWTASEKFIEVKQDWKHVKIRLLIQPEHKNLAKRHIESVIAALEYFEKHLGEYPYPNLTIVDPPFRGAQSGGMEYPTFITAGSFANMPNEMRLIENVTIHEFGHQYFMNILATNEFEEAWMDEGMNTYFETRIMDATYGEKTAFLGFSNFHIGDLEYQRLGYVHNNSRNIAESFRFAWDYPYGGYGINSYNKPATFLNTLQRIVGNECMDDIMKTYYKRWKFKHPSTNDFIAIVNEIVTKHHADKFGPNMNWFFDQVLYSSNICDYELSRISNKEIESIKGLVDKNGDKKLITNNLKDSATSYENKVIIKRLGELTMPVEILIHFENGREVTKYWDGKERAIEFKFKSGSKIDWAKIDPENKILIDVNLANNSYKINKETKPIKKYTVKFLFWLQNIIQSIIWFV
ncbi:MAG: M1 family metallopeptidase [Bacteroidales bacterium]|nr:M1 family metallopeptidase [Bacteroidales bacterium]